MTRRQTRRMGGVLGVLLVCAASAAPAASLRPPAVPLVQNDPYFSLWAQGDDLSQLDTTHWTGYRQSLRVRVGVDGTLFRLIGWDPQSDAPMPTASCRVTPTRTFLGFTNAVAEAELVFATPALPDDLEAFSRPVTYVTLRVRARDGKPHRFSLSAEITGAMAAPNDTWLMTGSDALRLADGRAAVRLGLDVQTPLDQCGDRLAPSWGRAWLVGPRGSMAATGGLSLLARHQTGTITADLGTAAAAETGLTLAYDDSPYSVSFLGRPLVAWWHRDGKSFETMLAEAEESRPALEKRMAAFDAELAADAARIGGEKYAALAALCWRQSFAACKLVAGPDGRPFYFSKENTSGGFIGTVDVFYPQFPQLALASPALARATLEPMMIYASGMRWKHPYAPHDLGVYPLADGQRYGGAEKTDENQMPVEECGNMLICLAVLSHVDRNADFAGRFWPTVTKWAGYLASKGFDPENQLCTDDFAGHLAHNANLSLKAIIGLACYAQMAAMRGEKDSAARFRALAEGMVPKWMKAAAGGRGGGYRLAFDAPDTWSMKYNLVWDRILGLNLFPREVAEKEMSAYRGLQGPFGLPLDSRKAWTKADWLVWTATLTGNRADFEALVAPLYRFADETPDRVPFSDWYWTDSGKFQIFSARSVVGGVFLPFLYDEALWRKYSTERNAR